VDRVAPLRLCEWQLIRLAGEVVRAVLESVRPRDEHLPAAGRRELALVIPVQHVAVADRV
jgi:hypothetical protein